MDKNNFIELFAQRTKHPDVLDWALNKNPNLYSASAKVNPSYEVSKKLIKQLKINEIVTFINNCEDERLLESIVFNDKRKNAILAVASNKNCNEKTREALVKRLIRDDIEGSFKDFTATYGIDELYKHVKDVSIHSYSRTLREETFNVFVRNYKPAHDDLIINLATDRSYFSVTGFNDYAQSLTSEKESKDFSKFLIKFLDSKKFSESSSAKSVFNYTLSKVSDNETLLKDLINEFNAPHLLSTYLNFISSKFPEKMESFLPLFLRYWTHNEMFTSLTVETLNVNVLKTLLSKRIQPENIVKYVSQNVITDSDVINLLLLELSKIGSIEQLVPRISYGFTKSIQNVTDYENLKTLFLSKDKEQEMFKLYQRKQQNEILDKEISEKLIKLSVNAHKVEKFLILPGSFYANITHYSTSESNYANKEAYANKVNSVVSPLVLDAIIKDKDANKLRIAPFINDEQAQYILENLVDFTTYAYGYEPYSHNLLFALTVLEENIFVSSETRNKFIQYLLPRASLTSWLTKQTSNKPQANEIFEAYQLLPEERKEKAEALMQTDLAEYKEQWNFEPQWLKDYLMILPALKWETLPEKMKDIIFEEIENKFSGNIEALNMMSTLLESWASTFPNLLMAVEEL